jgi:STE24 endopeptidase
MRVPRFLLCLIAFAALLPLGAGSAYASTTPTEAAAIAAAENDHTAYTLAPDKLTKAVQVTHFYETYHFAGAAWGMVSLLLILQLGIAARMRNVANNLSKNRWAQGFTFFFELLLLLSLMQLPLNMYAHHMSVVYGFSVLHWGGWFGDQLKTLLLSYVFGGLFVMLLFRLIQKFPKRWWLVLWFPTMVIVLGGVYISPYLIDPLFNTFEPLSQSNPSLVAELEKVAAHGKGIDIPAERMFLMKASAKTTTLNAYVTGFGGSKRLVVWDTLLAKATPDEISLIAGHEMGHYVLGHVVRGVLFYFVFILLSFYIGFHLLQMLLARFGRGWKIPSQDNWAALVVMMLVLDVISFAGEPVRNAVSRMMEHDADVFGQEAVHGVVADPQGAGQAAFQLLGETSLVDPETPAWIEFWTDSHPAIPFRAAFAKHYDPWAAGAEPKYFKK